MYKVVSIMVWLLLSVNLYAIGTGFSIFIPEAGTPSVEQSISADLTVIPDYLSFPFGINFNKISGINTLNISQSTQTWFYADSLQIFLDLKINIPFGNNFFISFFGGGILNWNIYLESKTGNIDRDLAMYHNYQIVQSDLSYNNKIGYGYEVGSSMGIRIRRMTFDITFSYIDIKHKIDIQGTYQYVDQTSNLVTTAFASSDAKLHLTGFKIGFNIDYAI